MNAEIIDPSTGRRKFGGPQPGSGRPRKPRAAEHVAEEARKEAAKIAQAFKDAIDPSQPIGVRVHAAKTWLEIENKESELTLREDRELRDMSQEELAQLVASRFTQLVSSGALDPELSSLHGVTVQNGDVIDLDEIGVADGE